MFAFAMRSGLGVQRGWFDMTGILLGVGDNSGFETKGFPVMASLNETHDPTLQSWVESATAASGFPIQNLPLASFRRAGSGESFRPGVAIGDQVLDLAAARRHLRGDWGEALAAPTLNPLMALGPDAAAMLRAALSRALRKGSGLAGALKEALVPMSGVQFAVPAAIGDYSDFYTSIHHATNIGRLFRPDNPLLP